MAKGNGGEDDQAVIRYRKLFKNESFGNWCSGPSLRLIWTDYRRMDCGNLQPCALRRTDILITK